MIAAAPAWTKPKPGTRVPTTKPPLRHRICSTAQQRHKAQKRKRKNPPSLLCCEWIFYHSPIGTSNSNALVCQCSPKACSTGFPCPGGAEPRGDAGGAPQVQSSGAAGAELPGQGWQSPPLPSDTSQTCLLCINILTTTPLQSLLKALIKTLTFLIPSIFCSLLIK